MSNILYKYTFSMVVLSDEPLTSTSLEDIVYEVTDGHCLGSGLHMESMEILTDKVEQTQACKQLGNDGMFFDSLEEEDFEVEESSDGHITLIGKEKGYQCTYDWWDDEGGNWLDYNNEIRNQLRQYAEKTIKAEFQNDSDNVDLEYKTNEGIVFKGSWGGFEYFEEKIMSAEYLANQYGRPKPQILCNDGILRDL